MAIDATITSFARDQFDDRAPEVVCGVVEALSEAQSAGCRAQRASGMKKRYPYGSVWSYKFELLVEQFQDLLGAEMVSVPSAAYQLVRVNGRLLIPFKLATSLADIPDRPRLTSEVLLAEAAKTVPPPEPEATLFDDLQPREASDPDESTEPDPVDAEVHPPIFVGMVCNADSDSLLGLYWGTATSIDEDGVMQWSPESLPLQVAPTPRSVLRTVPHQAAAQTPSFDAGEEPDLAIHARATPLDASCDVNPTESADPLSGTGTSGRATPEAIGDDHDRPPGPKGG